MKYTCMIIDNTPRERPLTYYSNSLSEIRRWANELIRVNPTSKAEIYETKLSLIQTIQKDTTHGF